MPILKQLAPNGPHSSKRRSRLDLTRDMISAPLGDFRHTMHVGRGGDAFGDTSFLSNHGPARAAEEANGEGEASKVEEGGLRSLPEEEEEVGRPGAGQAGREGDGRDGGGRRLAGEVAPSPPRSPPPPPPPGGLKHAESVLSFHVDLGPSMLSDVLGVMEKEPGSPAPHPDVPDQGHCEVRAGVERPSVREEEEEEEEEGAGYTFEEEEDDEIRV